MECAVELHIGKRPKESVYSGGYTSWQDKTEQEKNLQRTLPKVWFGWFGRGTDKLPVILSLFSSSQIDKLTNLRKKNNEKNS